LTLSHRSISLLIDGGFSIIDKRSLYYLLVIGLFGVLECVLKFNSLESLRGIAAVTVALFHSGFVVGEKYPIIAQGPIFVDFFFVLSGFVIAFAYLQKVQQGLSIKTFTLLRFGRLYP